VASGIIVVAHNHRGHGENCDNESLGHYADKDGWNKVIADALLVQNDAREDYADLPVVLMGHSMGSYIAQSFVMRHPQNVSQLILSASTYAPRLRLRLGKLLATFDAWRHGPRHRSEMLNQMSFGDFNKRFAPNRTDFDWLSRDEHEVDRYIDDPLCGAPSSSQLWRDLTGGMLEITSKRAVASVPNNIPLLVLGGQFDPVGGEKGLTLLADAYRKTGHEDVTLRVYADGRHEMLNETNWDEVTKDIIRWIEDRI
jgi:alpha-beta hydrolase superfamily lysophospholipase